MDDRPPAAPSAGPARSEAAEAGQPPAESARRRRSGGQPGNKNRLKHGFYARFPHPAGFDGPGGAEDSLAAEIAALRTFARRLMESSDADPDLRPLDALNGLGLAFIRIASLMRTQRQLSGGATSDFDHAVERAISAIQEEIACKP